VLVSVVCWIALWSANRDIMHWTNIDEDSATPDNIDHWNYN
jgi:hypothetical protein